MYNEGKESAKWGNRPRRNRSRGRPTSSTPPWIDSRTYGDQGKALSHRRRRHDSIVQAPRPRHEIFQEQRHLVSWAKRVALERGLYPTTNHVKRQQFLPSAQI